MGAEIRMLLQNDSLKSRSERTAYKHARSLVQVLVCKSHPYSELTGHKLSLVQGLFRGTSVTAQAPVTLSSSWERGGPNQARTFSSAA